MTYVMTSLIGRTILDSDSGNPRGKVVAVFFDCGQGYIAVEKEVPLAADGRTEVSVELLSGSVLGPDHGEPPSASEQDQVEEKADDE